MKQIDKLEMIFCESSLTDQLNALEASLLRGGKLAVGVSCNVGNIYRCGVGTESTTLLTDR
jgi:hypothetical protein